MIKIKSVKIAPEELEEITAYLEIADHILSGDYQPEWDDLHTVHRNICDALQDLKTIRERANAEIGFAHLRNSDVDYSSAEEPF